MAKSVYFLLMFSFIFPWTKSVGEDVQPDDITLKIDVLVCIFQHELSLSWLKQNKLYSDGIVTSTQLRLRSHPGLKCGSSTARRQPDDELCHHGVINTVLTDDAEHWCCCFCSFLLVWFRSRVLKGLLRWLCPRRWRRPLWTPRPPSMNWTRPPPSRPRWPRPTRAPPRPTPRCRQTRRCVTFVLCFVSNRKVFYDKTSKWSPRGYMKILLQFFFST